MRNADMKRYIILRKKISNSKDQHVQRTRRLFPSGLLTAQSIEPHQWISIKDGKHVNALHSSFLVAAIYHMY